MYTKPVFLRELDYCGSTKTFPIRRHSHTYLLNQNSWEDVGKGVVYISQYKTFVLFKFFIHPYKQNTYLTEVAGEGGPDLAPQKFLLCQKFRHLMG